jgi:hypothetical protein
MTCTTQRPGVAVGEDRLGHDGPAAQADDPLLAKLQTHELTEKDIKRRERIQQAPKSVRWETRAKIGTRIRWYEQVGDAEQQGQGDAGPQER